VVSVTQRVRFDPGDKTTRSQRIGGWVAFRDGVDTEARGKIISLSRGSNPIRLVVQAVVRHFILFNIPVEYSVKCCDICVRFQVLTAVR
jgi:hypothetical protein